MATYAFAFAAQVFLPSGQFIAKKSNALLKAKS